jgi:mono/diheme cytochrome c family protein
VRLVFLLMLLLIGHSSSMAAAASSILVVTAGGVTMEFTASELLTRADARRILVPRDPSYGEAMSYRGVPLPGLLAALPPDSAETIQARAKDGFVAEIPRALISGAAVPWIAIEDASHPWPPLRGKAISAGPFYLVWQYPERASISAEQWVYALAALTAVASPVQRWPTIAVDPTIPGDAPARRGQLAYIANCLPCHRLGGAGEATVGADLLQPMAATAYFTEDGLRALIRDPAAVRHWPAQQMSGFNESALSESDIDAVIAYLKYLAARLK